MSLIILILILNSGSPEREHRVTQDTAVIVLVLCFDWLIIESFEVV